MENVTISKRQAVELAKGIVQARDEELAFLLQIQEIVKSTPTLRDDLVEEENPSEPWLMGTELQDTLIAGDEDKAVALTVAEGELESLVEKTEETQLSLLEAHRLALLDAIQEHDAHFARHMAMLPQNTWEKTGDRLQDPFDFYLGPNELLAYDEADDQLDSVLLQLGDTVSSLPRKRLHSYLGIKPLVIRRVDVLANQGLNTEQKGKRKVHMETVPDNILSDSLVRKAWETNSHTDDEDCGQGVCQICFDAKVATSPFLSLEGCEHTFCETCVSKHAEAKILDGQTHITCPHGDCRTTISMTQLALLLSSKMLEILSRRQIEEAIPDSERLYCPFEDCSAVLCKPEPGFCAQRPSSSGHPYSTAIGFVECDACHRAFCFECEVPWHGDMSCAEYKADLKNQSLSGDKKLFQLADEKKWQRCRCGRVVELIQGCYHISCICGRGFCYKCGAPWAKQTGNTCSCPTWSESNL